MAYGFEVGDIIEFRDQQRQNAQTLINVYHFKVTDVDVPNTVGPGLLQALITALVGSGGMVRELALIQSSTLGHVKYYAQKVSPTRYRSETQPDALAGGLSGTASAQNVTASVEFFGELANRHNVGRKEIGGILATWAAAGILSPSNQVQFATYITTAITPVTVTSGGNNMTVAPIILNKASPLTSALVIGGRVQETTRVARRRTVGRGI